MKVIRYNATKTGSGGYAFARTDLRLQVQVFASLREIIGAPVALVEAPDGCSVGRLLKIFAEAYPGLKDGISSIRVAVNDTYARSEDILHAADRVALIPPVSGG